MYNKARQWVVRNQARVTQEALLRLLIAMFPLHKRWQDPITGVSYRNGWASHVKNDIRSWVTCQLWVKVKALGDSGALYPASAAYEADLG